MKMDVGLSLPKVALAAIVAFAIALLVLLAWVGGEDHYGNCLEKVAIQHPPTLRAGPAEIAAREDALAGCSRWP
jgi:hypothetical protein